MYSFPLEAITVFHFCVKPQGHGADAEDAAVSDALLCDSGSEFNVS